MLLLVLHTVYSWFLIISYQVQEELIQSIKEVEEGLLHLKRARLLREVDNAIQGSKIFSKDAKVEPLDPKVVAVHPFLDQNYSDVEAEPHALVDPNHSVGSKCRFRSTDGRWYNGLIVQLEGSNSALVSFLTPTSESMLVGTISFLSCFYAAIFLSFIKICGRWNSKLIKSMICQVLGISFCCFII